MAVLRGGIKIQMGDNDEDTFLQIYYATINCILVGVGGTRYGLFLVSCFDTYMLGTEEHWYTNKLLAQQ